MANYFLDMESDLRKVIDRLRCAACRKVVREPQKGTCSHSLCAKCWGTSGRCPVCRTQYRVNLQPNTPLSDCVQNLLLLLESLSKEIGVNVIENEVDDNSDETYPNKSKESSPSSENDLNIVNEWLTCSKNIFSQADHAAGLTSQRRTVRQRKSPKKFSPDTDSGRETHRKIIEKNAKKPKFSLDSTEVASIKKSDCVVSNRKTWRNVNIMKKILKPKTKKLDKVVADKTDDFIESDIPPLDKDALAILEVKRGSGLLPGTDIDTYNIDGDLDEIYNYVLNSTKECKQRVPFIYRGPLGSNIEALRNRVPFYYMNNKNNSRIDHGHLVSKESKENDVIKSPKENLENLKINEKIDEEHIDDDVIVIDCEENHSKKCKPNESEIHINEDIFVNFESQSQINKTDDDVDTTKVKNNVKAFKSVGNVSRTAPENTEDKLSPTKQLDEKLMLLKKSVDIYDGNKSDFQKSSILKELPDKLPSSPETVSVTTNADIDVVQDTPHKPRSHKITRKSLSKNSTRSPLSQSSLSLSGKQKKIFASSKQHTRDSDTASTLIGCSASQNQSDGIIVQTDNIVTPVSIFKENIRYQSTPLHSRSRKSLYTDENSSNTSCEISTTNFEPETKCDETQGTNFETEFIEQAFETESSSDGIKSPILTLNRSEETDPSGVVKRHFPMKENKSDKSICVVCSRLARKEKQFVKIVANKLNWKFSETFNPDTTHLIVNVNENNVYSMRTAKYLEAISVGCWIVSYAWINECMSKNSYVKEDKYEALDESGVNGPYLMRNFKKKILNEMIFYFMPYIKVIEIDTLKRLVSNCGGTVVDNVVDISIREPHEIKIVITDAYDDTKPEANNLLELCMLYQLFPVHIDWLVNSICEVAIRNCYKYISVPFDFVAKRIQWPSELYSEECDSE